MNKIWGSYSKLHWLAKVFMHSPLIFSTLCDATTANLETCNYTEKRHMILKNACQR